MTSFASKPLPDAGKLRGGYYTPAPVAEFLAAWVAEAGPCLLEPSCGDGVILSALAARVGTRTVQGVELFDEEADKARAVAGARVHNGDFFAWRSENKTVFDGVAGNPPYIRFGNWKEDSREIAFEAMRSAGLRPTKLTNAWVPFVVSSVLSVRQGGRVGLVLPAELLQVGYAAALRGFLVDNCSDLTLISFDRLLFDGVLQEVILLMGVRGEGPSLVRTMQLPDASALSPSESRSQPSIRAALHDTEKWTKYYLTPELIESLRTARSDSGLEPLRTYAEVDVGIVSGRNAFFCMTTAEAAARALSEYCLPLVSRSQQLAGTRYDREDLERAEGSTTKTRLLFLGREHETYRGTPVWDYLEEGVAAGVPEGFKCRTRKRWWEVPSVWTPDAFMLRQISTHPRIIANYSGATSNDTVHRVRVRRSVDPEKLAVVAINSVTFALSEVMGRSYGGGILELEPTEAEALPVPDPSLVPDWCVMEVDRLVRGRELDAALDLVDRVVLLDKLGIAPKIISDARQCWRELQGRRSARGAKNKTRM